MSLAEKGNDSRPDRHGVSPSTPRPLHWVCYGLLCVMFVYVLVARYGRPLLLNDPIGVEYAARVCSSKKLDTTRPPALASKVGAYPGHNGPANAGGTDGVRQVQQQIDPNVADWAELAQLPGLGETKAKRIVAYRQEQAALRNGGRDTPVVVFRGLEDLDAVRGIGPKTLVRLADFLRFPVEPAPPQDPR